MRLRSLDLIRYGRFTDRTLDFGPGGAGCDVTVVYGPNEAGKSTAFSAWLDLLFGLPLQHSYDFLHARRDLLVGATLDTADGPLTLRRTGQRSGSLTDDQGRTVDERRLELLLHGLDRDAYRTRFSLDDEVLRKGGKEIAEARGDLGQLLHAGASGLSGFAETLKDAEAEVERFHKPRGRSTTLAEARNRLKEIETALEAARLDPRRFDALQAEMAAADEALRAADVARDAARRALALREAADARRDMAHEIAGLEADLSGFPGGPVLPGDAAARLASALEALAQAQAGTGRASAALSDAQGRLEALAPDPEGLRVGVLVAELEAAVFDDGEQLVVRASAADADLARRRQERDAAKADVRARAERLAGPDADPAHIALPPDLVAGLRSAATDLRAAARAATDARRTLEDAQATLGPAEEMPEGADALADALAALDALRDDPEALAATARDSAAQAAQAAAGLPEGWEALARAGLPPAAELRDAAQAVAAAEAAKAQAAAHRAEAEEALAERTAQQAAEAMAEDAVTDADIAATRQARDNLWSRHRAALDTETAKAFEAAMHTDDRARARHGATRDARARLARIAAELETLRARLVRRGDALDAARLAGDRPRQAAARLALRLGLDDSAPLSAHAERRDALQAALEAAQTAERTRADQRRAEDARDTCLAQVAAAMSALTGTTPAMPDALPEARRRRADHDARRARIASRAEAARLVEGLGAEAARKNARQAEAAAAFASLSDGLWCADLGSEAFLRIADDIAALSQAQGAAQGLDRRVARMEAALAAFEDRAVALRRVLGPEAAHLRVAALLHAARTRATAAERTGRDIALAHEDRTKAEAELTRLAALIDTAAARRDAVFDGQEAAPGDDPEGALARLLARDALRARLKALRDAYAKRAEGFEAAVLAAEEADPDPLRTATLGEAVQAAEDTRDGVQQRRGEAREALDATLRSDGASGQAQARAILLEDLRAQARRAALTRIGLIAASGALRRLREERRGPMLQAAEAAFRQMTGGEWPRLEAQPTGTGERLVGVRGGEAVPADAMSTGTRGQLYLALRVAGHADFVTRFGALPFLTDDILETFDDDRAAAALRLAAEMGRIGQAIMFTHHQHLVQMAQDEIPDLRILELRPD